MTIKIKRHVGLLFVAPLAVALIGSPLPLSATAVPDAPVKNVPDVNNEKPPFMLKQRNFFVVPIPLSNPTLGTGLILAGAYFYRQTPEQRKVQPPSVTGVAGMYTSNESYAYGILQQNYWGGDKWRFSGFLGYVDLDLDLSAPDAMGANVDVDWQVRGDFLQAKILRRIAGDWYGGIYGRYFNNEQAFSTSVSGGNFGFDLKLKTVGLGLNGEYDTRDVPTNAYKGRIFQLDALFNEEVVGSTDSYQGYNARFRSYHELNEKLVFAWEIRGCYMSGRVPLWDACKVNLRGFPVTEYLSKTSASTQGEARWHPYKHLGFVAFVGGGLSERNFADLREDTLIPSYGVGLRWMVMEAQRINMRLDYGRSEDQGAIYLSVGEAF